MAVQLELTFGFNRGGIPPTPEARWKFLDPNRPGSPYHGFVGNRKSVQQLMRIDFDALGRYNHLCNEVALAFVGPSGSGKTALARRHAKVLGLPFAELSGPTITSAQDIFEAMQRVCAAEGMPLGVQQTTCAHCQKLIAINPELAALVQRNPTQVFRCPTCQGSFTITGLTEVKCYDIPPIIVFIDDADSLIHVIFQMLSKATANETTDRSFDTERGITVACSSVHWMVAATDLSNLPEPLRGRFMPVSLTLCTEDELSQLVKLHYPGWGIATCRLVAQYCPQVPATALSFAADLHVEQTMNPGSWEDVAARVASARQITGTIETRPSAEAKTLQTERASATEAGKPLPDLLATKLREMLSQFGRSLVDEPGRLRSMLMDACPSEQPRIRILMNTLKLGIAVELSDSASLASPDLVLSRWARRVKGELRHPDEDCRWVVETWACALQKTERSFDAAKGERVNQSDHQKRQVEFHKTDERRKLGEIYTNSLGMKFAWIPPGTFLVGSPKTEEGREPSPGADEFQHKVTLTKGFFIGVHQVTRGQFAMFVQRTGFKTQAEREGGADISTDKERKLDPSGILTGKEWKRDPAANWRNPGFEQTNDHPVTCVSWNDAIAFAEWLVEQDNKPYRLPSEAEWEYACRAGTTAPFHFGETISTDQANYNGDYTYGCGTAGIFRQKTTPVASFPANAWGLYDMHGNVWEWCQDWFGKYPRNDVMDPRGPETGQPRVLRGGCWCSHPRYCRSANRRWHEPGYRYDIYGFRVCFSVDTSHQSQSRS